MNPYLLGMSLYTLFILPVTLRFRVRLGGRSGYRLRLQAAGLPFARKRAPEDKRDERPFPRREMAQALAGTDLVEISKIDDAEFAECHLAIDQRNGL